MKNKNHIKTTLTAIMILLGIAVNTTAQEYDFKQGQLYYKITTAETMTVEVVTELGTFYGYNEGNHPKGSVVIPATVIHESVEYSVTSIGEDAFIYYCEEITDIQIGANVTSMKFRAIDGRLPALIAITVAEGNSAYMAIDGILFTSDGKELIVYPLAKTATTYTIPNGVERLGRGAFQHNETLTALTLPASLKEMGEYVLAGCPNLTQLIGIENTQLTYIASYSVNGLGIASFSIPKGIEVLTDYFLSACENLTEVDIPSSVKNIYWYTFAYNPILATVRCHAVAPPLIPENSLPTVFLDTDIASATLYVPEGSKALYEAAPLWQDFGTIIDNLPVLSISALQSDNVKVWTSGKTLHISLSESNDVYIYNMLGALTTKLSNVSGDTNINLPQAGVYVVKIGSYTIKVVIN